MYLLLEKTQNHAIVCITEQMKIDEETGSIYVPRENTYYAPDTLDIAEVEIVPEEIQVGRHCYTEERGFYENPNYKVPAEETLEKMESRFDSLEAENAQLKMQNNQLQETITDLQLALTELYEGGI